ncbi:hypothetical protein VaNZ11_003640, partial [Volvox africanus]
MADPTATLGQRPSKRVKSGSQDKGPDLQPCALLKYNLKLPQSFTPGSLQANRVALRVAGDSCLAYIANAQHVYEVSLGSDLLAARSSSSGDVDQGKEGVLVPRNAQVGHIRQMEPLSNMAAEVQGLYAGIHGGYHVLAAVDSVGNARLLATAMSAPPSGDEGSPGEHQLMALDVPCRGECGWTGLAVRSVGSVADGGGAEAGGALFEGPLLEVAVARQRMRDVLIYRNGARLRTLHTMQGPTALAYLGSAGSEAPGGLLAIAEEHQISLWDVQQGGRGGCVQRLGVYGGGCPVYGLTWISTVAAAEGRSRQQGGDSGDEGLLAATGGARSVVMLEPRKWHIVAKWPGCVKYPATHMRPSALAPGYVFVAGLDYECVAGRWDGRGGSCSGNANSSSGGHGRAMGPAQLIPRLEKQQQQADDGLEGATCGRVGLSFRGDSKWLGLACCSLPPLPEAVGSNRDGGCRE